MGGAVGMACMYCCKPLLDLGCLADGGPPTDCTCILSVPPLSCDLAEYVYTVRILC